MPRVKIDDKEYDIEGASQNCIELIAKIDLVNAQLMEKANMLTMLTKAKHACVSELKTEMLSAKAGLDFTSD